MVRVLIFRTAAFQALSLPLQMGLGSTWLYLMVWASCSAIQWLGDLGFLCHQNWDAIPGARGIRMIWGGTAPPYDLTPSTVLELAWCTAQRRIALCRLHTTSMQLQRQAQWAEAACSLCVWSIYPDVPISGRSSTASSPAIPPSERFWVEVSKVASAAYFSGGWCRAANQAADSDYKGWHNCALYLSCVSIRQWHSSGAGMAAVACLGAVRRLIWINALEFDQAKALCHGPVWIDVYTKAEFFMQSCR